VSASGTDEPWRQGAACVIVRFRLTPKSSKDSIDGLEITAEGRAFKARVRAVPEDGEANAALEKLVASWLDVPKSAVSLVSGAKSRVKNLAIGGDPKSLEHKLAAKLADASGVLAKGR
jgi:uncharacterized protein YggU (UPF0235/DUF167 family)